MGRLSLSVIIVTYNRSKDLEECLYSLTKMKETPDEIIVVDSRSTDGTQRVVEQYPVKFITINERSMVKARNIGLQHAKGDIIAYVDDDAVVCENWSKNILEPYRDEIVGGVGGRVIPYGRGATSYVPAKHKAIGKVFENGLVLGNFDIPIKHPIEVDALIGCNMSFRRELLLKVQGFDENFRGSCFRDDTDMSLRVRGLKSKLIYHPKAVVHHRFKGKSVDNKWFYYTIYNHTYFYLKNFKPINGRKILEFLFATFLPPADYLKKTDIRLKPNLLSIAYVISGLINAVWIHKRGDPSRIEKILRIS